MGLYWGEPKRERSGVVFDEKSNHSFVGAEGGSVDTDGGFFLAVFADVGEIEFFGNREVELVCGEGEFPSDDGPYLDVYFGTVKSAFVFCFYEGDVEVGEGVSDLFFGLYPEFWFVYIFFSQT